MKKMLLCLFAILSVAANAQMMSAQDSVEVSDHSLYQPNYPEGIYKTKEDFINRKPRWSNAVTPKGIYGLTKKTLTTIEHNCFFFFTKSNVKIEDVFAISYQGHLYFQIDAILNNRNKTDRMQSSSFPNSFVRTILGGDNYLYTEVQLANAWAKGAGYGVGGAVGGVIAQNSVYGKGVVWDHKNAEFNIFKNCEDFNEFIKDKDSSGKQTCKKNQPDVLEIRKTIEKIK